ncbi:hypothetical protein BHF71_08150 [Vulcanibacillus modesticaldus]|uniref:Uncharacterized protein n=1 Tax=Vulcanibacillus modesticaldus TaxID=337097 RepID=A0A1D2YV97_9BACI|nr:hypothetical protein BHF71_08150 [Vulcanibacillus modesticaldus]
MDERVIYNYQLFVRFRRTLFWVSFFITTLLASFLLNIIINPDVNWSKTLTILFFYYLSYQLWGVICITWIKKGIKFSLPFLPWYGVVPKKMLSFQEYIKFETGYFLLFCLSLLLIIQFFPIEFRIVMFSLILVLFMYRIYLWIRVLLLNNRNIRIRYEYFGISVYKTK